MINYDAWLIWDVTEKCSLSCYGCTTDVDKMKQEGHYEKIDINTLKRILDETNKIFHISFSGGEPFIIPNIIDTFNELTKKHYISIITNLISKKITEFVENIDPKRVNYILASAHIDELNRTKNMKQYISNFLLCRKKGFTINAQEIAYPFLLKHVKEYKKLFSDNGIELTFNPFRGKWDNRMFPRDYTEKEKKVFNLDHTITSDTSIFYQYGKLCNAGFNTGIVLPDGTVKPCFYINKIQGNIYKGFKFNNHLITCPNRFCDCPLNSFDKELFNRAIKENKKKENSTLLKQQLDLNKMLRTLTKKEKTVRINKSDIVKKNNKSGYCLFTNKTSENGINVIKHWIEVLGGEIYKAKDTMSSLKDEDYDIILINASNEDINLIGQIRKKIGNNSITKIAAVIDSPVERWKIELNNIKQLRNNLKCADFIIGTEYYSVSALQEVLKKKIFEIQHPVNIEKLKSMQIPQKNKIISVLVHEYAYNIYIPYLAINQHGMRTRLLNYNRFRDRNSSVTETLYRECCPPSNMYNLYQQILESSVVFESEICHTQGVITASAAALGIPVIGSDRVESIRRCYPHTTVDPYDTKTARDLIHKVLKDGEFRTMVIQTALKNVEYYRYKNFKKRLNNILFGEKKIDNTSISGSVDSKARNGINTKKSKKGWEDWDIKIHSHNFKSNPEGKINIKEQPAFKQQRSGWTYAINSLGELHNDNGVLFDGFLENTFAWKINENKERKIIPYKNKWVGIFHNPPNLPEYIYKETSIQMILQKPEFVESLKFCAGFLSLSDYHAEFLRKNTGKPVSVLYHPTETEVPLFNFTKFFSNEDRKIVTIGWWLRKLNSIFLLPLDDKSNYKKVRLLPYFDKSDPVRISINKFIEQEKKIYKITYNEKYYNNTETCTYLTNQEYDKLLSGNIVFLDLYDANANNSIVECIARCTPVLVNPLPAVREYLGKDYPFYFNNLEEAAHKAQDIDLIKKTHEYLTSWHIREKITGTYFCNSFKNSTVYGLL